ncbi:MAG: ribosome recycling factor [Pelotomaculum sp.]|uniref:Ribosome-recycling factor n=1 Tax=Pelotomaculum thermopropionicum (strain DSM 13744 / JCM 10971 / SI) TaxID=370438 RepID=RRF_PELTS|nr:RecName: Full=Ribosome-recycling factor; Short=RRF; AltName: Full=Ribosome-releasing factor [Pelotomaculum thermopropionicum SI]NPV72261.1 ribosome recycling factor [Pelotomaculum sp.]BAF59436.1 ribosome recycling factor [Pelotomaculum thermopropionicum SI]
MAGELIKEAESNMKKTIEVVKKEFASLRAGRATPALLDKVMVNYYGTPTPVNQLANISVPEARLLVVQPWDKTVLPEIERAILKSDLGITPASDGNVIRLAIPQLTQERRAELMKVIKKKAEEGRVAIRNIRRDTNEQLKSQQKDGKMSEDELKRSQDEVQKLTDRYIKEIDSLLSTKEQEIMQV